MRSLQGLASDFEVEESNPDMGQKGQIPRRRGAAGRRLTRPPQRVGQSSALSWVVSQICRFGRAYRWERLRSAAMEEIWAALAAIAALVAVGVTAAQLGGRRGIQCKAIREDLELLKMLDGSEHALVRERLRARVTKKLEQYEPGPDAKSRSQRRRQLAVGFVVLAAIAVAIINVFDVTGPWVNLLLGGALGLGGNVVLWIVTSRREKAEQDQAVAEVRLDGVLPRKVASFSMTVDPENTAASGNGRSA